VLQRVKNEIARAVSVPGIYTHTHVRTYTGPRPAAADDESSESQSIAHSTRRSAVRSLGSPKQPAGQAGTARQSKHNVQTASAPALPILSLSLSLSAEPHMRERETTRRPSVALSANALRAFSHHTQNSPRAHTQYITARAAPHMPDFRPNPSPFPTFFALYCKFLSLRRSDSDFEPLL